MVNDELISDERWIQETLESDEEVKASKQRILSSALNDKGEIPCIFRMASHTPLQPLAENSKELQLVRKTLAATRSKKQLQGLHETILVVAALLKTSGSTMTIKCPGQDDTVLHKSEVARFGTSSQPKIPLIQFAARKTVINHHGKIQRHMNVHQRDQCAKPKGEKTFRKKPNDSPTNPNVANLQKVNRTKVPPETKFIQSPRKGKTGSKSQSKTTTPDSPFEDEDFELAAQRPVTRENSEDPDYDPQEDPIVQEIAKNKKPRRSGRKTKKPEKYGHSETLTTDDDTEGSEQNFPRKSFNGTADCQPTTTMQDNSQAQQLDEYPTDPTQPMPENDDELKPPQQAPIQQSDKSSPVVQDNEERERESKTPMSSKNKLENFFIPPRGNMVHGLQFNL